MGETTTDTLVLAASTPVVPPGSIIFDLGTGNGDVVRAASRRIKGCLWAGIDIREATLREFPRCIGNGEDSPRFFPVCCRMEDVTSVFPRGCADVVLSNPPYGNRGRSRTAPDQQRSLSRSGTGLLLYVFLRASAHLLRPGGLMVMVNRPGNMDRILTGCAAFDLAPDAIQPVGDEGGQAVLVVVSAMHSRRREMRLLPQLTVGDVIERQTGISRLK